jgi:O-acetyl-ADP-ribose deacetylase (regulator of RNase III)
MAAWFFVDDQHGVLPCSYSSSHELELAFQKRKSNPVVNPQCIDIAMAGVLYQADIVLMEQYNPSTKRIRALQRHECSPTVTWEGESTLEASLFAGPKPVAAPGSPTVYDALLRYWCVILEYFNNRVNSAIHKHLPSTHVLKMKSDRGEITIDAKSISFSSFGGLVTTKGTIRRVIQAVDDDEEGRVPAAESTSAPPTKRGRVEVEATALGAPSSRVPKTAPEPTTPVKRGPIPATLLEDTPDSKSGPPVVAAEPAVVRRGPGFSHGPSPAAPHVVEPAVCGWAPPGWAAAVVPPVAPVKFRLLFPSFSTAVFMFDINLAAAIACNSIAKFLASHPKHAHPWIDLCLIDAPQGPDTDTIRAFKKAWAAVCPHGEDRFSFLTADVTSFAQRGVATFIANASNATFNGGPATGGFNRAIYVAAGDKELQADTRATYPKGGSVGPCFEVPLRTSSPLYAEGTRYILHVVGPNMNPTRPNCLHGDYAAGKAQLSDCYQNMLDTYETLAKKL